MKKGRFKKFLAGTAMGLCALAMPFGLTGCNKDDDEKNFDPYISVFGIDTEYVLNEELDLSGAVLKYYKDKDTDQSDIVTKEMVTWQGTDCVGEYTMHVVYNGESVAIKYNVYDADSIIQLVKETTNSKTEIQVDQVINGSGVDYAIYKTNSEYYYDNTDGGTSETDYVRQSWYVIEDNQKFEYSYHTENGFVTYKEKYQLDNDDKIGVQNVATLLESYSDSVKTLQKNGDGSFTLSCVEMYEDSYGKRIYSDIFVIKNGLIISEKNTTTYLNNGIVSEYYETESLYKYDNVSIIPAIPQNVDWQLGE
ncbi:MAG: hypothetical protein E7361_00370 [Clostridiales bacterium]|nr:hypothetical protein [Clostridiales bacterium]